ncbi:hypothetical protein AJ78_03484 [Emergomyces pasteurianus Ep9510]|uniref:Uncharacterized protein n=1 Tax=Emergomyces pasteurianus Ep9510 TaxID=1447872 RepID=A0A1J9PJX7_9EURO|nr:hypothetical protein AJ78_03484 [Emergomyces pasteurianus Ep9510]
MLKNDSVFTSGDNSPETIVDSAFITKQLVEQGTLPDLNLKSSDSDDLAIRALIGQTWERRTQFIIQCVTNVLSPIPYQVRVLVSLLVYRNTTQTLYGQGVGRYSAEEIAVFSREIRGVINQHLVLPKNKPTGHDADDRPLCALGTDQPTEADATVGPDSETLVKQFPVILDYAGRIHDIYFPDHDKWED